ncbi:MAG: DNA recombination protein RmuC [Alphaproteobacteria bacterium]|nr:DNA recombination protein RmuC [Alphaproteobacteria bacterium]
MFNPTLFYIGQHPVSLTEFVVAVAAIALALLLLAVILAWRAQSGRRAAQDRARELEYHVAEISGALQNFSNQAQGQQMNLQRTLDERLDQVSQRVGYGLNEQTQRTAQSLSQLHERLAVIDAAQNNLAALSGEMMSLKDILSNKQTRGAFGQGRMEAIITDGLHSKAYAFQATLSNGTRPDCLISLPDSKLKLVIDSKFPLESYNAMRESADEASHKSAEARLKADVLKHVKDIAEKYLVSGETHETAIMFVPSESVYAELNEKFEDVVQKAHRMRVILASPNVLMLLVQTMQAIVKDAAMREQAHVIQGEVVKLLEDVTRVKDRVGDLKRHFEMANNDLDKLGISAERVTKRGLRIESMELGEPQQATTDPQHRLANG